MTEQKSKRGGYRAGSGRKAGAAKVAITIRITPHALERLNQMTTNKSECIEKLILNAFD